MEPANLDLLPADASLYVLSSNYTVPAFLARGLLLAPGAGESSEIPFLDRWGNHLVVNSGGVPTEWAHDVELGARNAFPILLRCRNGVKPKVIGKGKTAIDYLRLEDVDRLVFRSEEERERFFGFDFANMPAINDDMLEVRAAAFAHPIAGRRVRIPEAPKLPNAGGAHLRRADALAALAAVTISRGMTAPGWIPGLREIAGPAGKRQPVRSFVGRLAELVRSEEASEEAEIDSQILAATVAVLMKQSIEQGWPALEILERIRADSASRLGASPDQVNDLERWAKHCRDVVEGREEPPVLSDDRSIVRRAVLLLLLRGAVEELDAGHPSVAAHDTSIGRAVRQLALALAAIRTGFRALDRTFKDVGNRDGRQDLRPATSTIFLDELVGAPTSKRAAVTCTLSGDGAFSAAWTVHVAGVDPIVVPMFVEPAVAEFSSRLEALKYRRRPISSETDEGGVAFALGADDRSLRAFARPVRIGQKDPEMLVRIDVDDGAVGARPGKRTMQMLTELLELQASVGFEGRFAITAADGQLYVLSEIAQTGLDDGALRRRLGALYEQAMRGAHVVRTAVKK
jgi:hypothetical protein